MDLRSLRYFVAVAEESHIGRAALRLHMTQPPLSRAIKALEAEIGAVLLHRSSTGVSLTPAGTVLYGEARTLLEQAEQARTRVSAAAGTATLTIGILADSAEQAGTLLAAAFRQVQPNVDIRIREADLTDPTTGLRAGLVDVALTRAPFDTTGISTHVLRSDPVGVVLRTDDPLAHHQSLHVRDLADRRWFRLPPETDAAWRAYWNGIDGKDTNNRDGIRSGMVREGPVIRTVQECLQAVFWNDTIGLTPLDHALPEGLICVPLTDMAPSRLVVAWNTSNPNPLIRAFTHIAAATYRVGR